MNKIGKILVFVLLLFSLITPALLVMAFVTRIQWQKAYSDEVRDHRGDRLTLIAVTDERNKTVGEKNKQLEQAELELKRDKTAIEEALAARNKAEDALKEAIADKLKFELITKEATTERTNLLVELKRKDELIVTRDELIVKMTKEGKTYRDEAIKYKIQAESGQARSENLMAQYEKLLKEFESLRGDKLAKSGQLQLNPPPEDVKGTIKSTDTSGLVVINLGSDSGLTKGNTLHVYRTAPKPTYVGLLRIQDVRQNEAVGKLVSSARPNLIQVGDEVASKILDNR